MAMWTDILGGLGAAGGGYAQALEKIKAQKLDEKTQADLKKYREEESAQRAFEERARLRQQGERDKATQAQRDVENLRNTQQDAQDAADRYHDRIARERAEEHRRTEALLNAEARATTTAYQREQAALNAEARAADRPPENHAIVAARRALELTANKEDGGWQPAAAESFLRENHQDDGELEEFLRGMNYVLVQEMDRAQEQRTELDPAEIFNMPADLQREYYEGLLGGGGGQPVDWGYNMPLPPIMDPDTGLPFISEQGEHGGRIPGEDPMPGTFIPQGTTGGVPITPAISSSNRRPDLWQNPDFSRQQRVQSNLGRTPGGRPLGQTPGGTGFGDMLDTTGVSAPTPGDTTISKEEAQRQLDELRRLIPGT